MPDAATGPLILGASGQVGYFLLQRLGADALACARRVPAWSTRFATPWRTFNLWHDELAPPTAQLISAGPLDACVAWLERSGPGDLRSIVALSSMSAVHKLESPSLHERGIAQRLRESEQRLQAFARTHDITCTILRPTLIWGAGLDHSLTPFAQRAAQRGFALVPSGANGLRQPVHADDLAVAAIQLLAPPAGGAILEAAGPSSITLGQLLAISASAVGARVVTIPLPPVLLRLCGRVLAALQLPIAAAVMRGGEDQCVASNLDWAALGIVPRALTPRAFSAALTVVSDGEAR